jgi:hypothetical protein
MRSNTPTPHNMRACRWCQPQDGPTSSAEEDVAAAPWECVRTTGQERPVSDAECAGCEYWEPDQLF